MSLRPPRAILFDLDGTLADTAPDLAAAANFLRQEHGMDPAPYETLRPVASAGARGLIGAALDIHPGDERYEALKARFLDRYEANMTAHSKLFDSVPELLAQLEARGIAWGIVTNKPGWLTRPLLDQMALQQRCAAVVTGDCLPVRKPDPAPVLHACVLAGIDAETCVFVGDDLRDVQAGRAAGTRTIAAAWGYLNGGDPHAWGADHVVDRPAALPAVLGLI